MSPQRDQPALRRLLARQHGRPAHHIFYGKSVDTETFFAGAGSLSFCVCDVFGRSFLVSGAVSYPPGRVLEFAFLVCVSAARFC